MRTTTRSLLALALAATLAACGTEDPGATSGAATDQDTSVSTDEDSAMQDDASGDTSMPAEDVTPSGEVSQGEAEAVGGAYVGLTVDEAMAQAEIDQRRFRIGSEDGEDFMLTEDYVLGRVTATVTDGVVTQVVVEATPGPVTVTG